MHGFIRVGAAVPVLKVANCGYNGEQIIGLIKKAEALGVQLVAFPELSITAYTCQDLFFQDSLLNNSLECLGNIIKETADLDIVSLLGLPIRVENRLYSCAAIICKSKILGIIPKTYIPAYSEFYEERWFSSSKDANIKFLTILGQQVPFGTDIIFEASNNPSLCFGVEICEDLWVTIPPSSAHTLAGAIITFNLSASNEIVGKYEYRKNLVNQQSARCMSGYVYCSAGVHESTTDLVFSGHSIISEYGSTVAESKRFSLEEELLISEIDIDKLINLRLRNTCFKNDKPIELRKVYFNLKKDNEDILNRYIDSHPFVPANILQRNERCEEIFNIQTFGLAKRMKHTGLKKAVIGISGGLDSTLALLVTCKTFDLLSIPKENIIAITMPGFGTSNATYTNALELIKFVGASCIEISIKDACIQHFKDIGHDFGIHDTTYENSQARERTQILMDVANKENALVVGTGDMSELALGWCTYNGDHMSMYAVNAGVPKTLVKFLIAWVRDNSSEQSIKSTLNKIIDTPISPELIPLNAKGEIVQRTEDIVGAYELHDFFLFHVLKYGASPKKVLFLCERAFEGVYGKDEIKKRLKEFYKRFFGQQFKRSCLPDGPKVGTISLSPRGDLRMSSDADVEEWINPFS